VADEHIRLITKSTYVAGYRALCRLPDILQKARKG
jgi:hypothetical protein